jgi:hypothetical protein
MATAPPSKRTLSAPSPSLKHQTPPDNGGGFSARVHILPLHQSTAQVL